MKRTSRIAVSSCRSMRPPVESSSSRGSSRAISPANCSGPGTATAPSSALGAIAVPELERSRQELARAAADGRRVRRVDGDLDATRPPHLDALLDHELRATELAVLGQVEGERGGGRARGRLLEGADRRAEVAHAEPAGIR